MTGNIELPSTVRNANGVVLPVGSLMILFIIYIKNIGSGLTSNIGEFSNDTKIGQTIRTGKDARALQEDLSKLSAWSNQWQMSFDITKCSILTVGTRTPLHGYSLNSPVIGRTDCERDLGVLVNSDLKLRNQCISVKNKTNRVLGVVVGGFWSCLA